MSKAIRFALDNKSIDSAIKEIQRYKKELQDKEKQFLEALAMIGVKEASIRFTTAMYDGVNDVKVTLIPKRNRYVIEAKGQAVAFIEFGAGVYHNSGEPYPNPRPEGVVGIGEFGEGRGKRKTWYYQGDAGSSGEVMPNGVVKTHGNPAAMPMWYATTEMQNAISNIAKEVFK